MKTRKMVITLEIQESDNTTADHIHEALCQLIHEDIPDLMWAIAPLVTDISVTDSTT